jgi:hypothetical protein
MIAFLQQGMVHDLPLRGVAQAAVSKLLREGVGECGVGRHEWQFESGRKTMNWNGSKFQVIIGIILKMKFLRRPYERGGVVVVT